MLNIGPAPGLPPQGSIRTQFLSLFVVVVLLVSLSLFLFCPIFLLSRQIRFDLEILTGPKKIRAKSKKILQ